LLALLLCFLGPWGAIAAGASAAEPVRKDQLPIAPGPFQPTTTSLKTYQYPIEISKVNHRGPPSMSRRVGYP